MSNPVIEVIKKRQSVRLYEKPVPREIIKTIIEAAHHAPFMSDERYQPWRFVVVEDIEFRQQLVQSAELTRAMFVERLKETQPEMYEMAERQYGIYDDPNDLIFYSAPVIIYVIAPAANSVGSAMVCQSIITAAGSYGIGSCYVGFGGLVKSKADVVKALELTEDERIYGPVIIGYPKANPRESQVKALAELRPKKRAPVVKWI